MWEHRAESDSLGAGVRERVNQEMPFQLCLEKGIGLCRAKKG